MHDRTLCALFHKLVNPSYVEVMVRLYVEEALAAGAMVEVSPSQAHYLGVVMRRSVGDAVSAFNGEDGEWSCRIASLGRGRATLRAETLLRPQRPDADLWLVFAVLKRDATDLVVQKATELGVSVLQPIFTERTNASRVNEHRIQTIAIEAAEQSERLTVPLVFRASTLEAVLQDWQPERRLFAAMERGEAPPLKPHRGPAALLIGPEGGFGPRDRALMERSGLVTPVSLGPRILRAETAAIVGLTLLQASGWD